MYVFGYSIISFRWYNINDISQQLKQMSDGTQHMKKNIIALLLSIVMTVGSIGGTPVLAAGTPPQETAAAETDDVVASGTSGNNTSWILSGTGDDLTLTISGRSDVSDHANAGNNDVYPPWSNYRTRIKTVIVENGVTSIGYCAFEDCSGLTSMVIPNSVTSIGSCAFRRCSSLESVIIPDSVTTIGHTVFSDCRSLTSVTIPNSVTSIGDYTFRRCSGLKSVTIPDSVTSIGHAAFAECSSLTSAVLPDGLTNIKAGAFLGCEKMTSLWIGSNVASIGNNAFDNCKSLTVYTENEYVIEFCESNNINCENQSFDGGTVIPAKNLETEDTEVEVPVQVYKGSDLKPVPTVTVDGDTLIRDKDYTVSYENNINAGTATIIITGIGDYTGRISKSFIINKAVNKISAKSFVKTYSTKQQSFETGAKVSNGTPSFKSNSNSVTVSKSGKVTIKAKFIGKAAITITAPETKNYKKSTKNITVTVNPTKTALSSVSSPSAGKMTVKWKKNSVGTGYQIQFSTSSKFVKPTSVTITKNTMTTRNIGSLAKGKKYYVRIRTYKTVGKTKFYSAWSAAKSVTIKKK